jgi:hypothetical protein
MLDFERRFVDVLVTTGDPEVRSRVQRWVDGSLRTMPQHLRVGVLGQTILLSGWTALRGQRSPADLDRLPATLERSPLMPLRQYVRLFRSLVLFAEQELAPSP